MKSLCDGQIKPDIPVEKVCFSLSVFPRIPAFSLSHTVRYKNHSVEYIFHSVGYKSRIVEQRMFGGIWKNVCGSFRFCRPGGKFVQSVGLSGRLCHFLLLFS